MKSTSYSPITKFLHRLIASHFVVLIALGWWVSDLSFCSRWYYFAPILLKAFGILVFLVGIAMLVAQHVWKRSASDQGDKAWQKPVSKTAHLVLIASAVAVPLSWFIFIV